MGTRRSSVWFWGGPRGHSCCLPSILPNHFFQIKSLSVMWCLLPLFCPCCPLPPGLCSGSHPLALHHDLPTKQMLLSLNSQHPPCWSPFPTATPPALTSPEDTYNSLLPLTSIPASWSCDTASLLPGHSQMGLLCALPSPKCSCWDNSMNKQRVTFLAFPLSTSARL